MIKHFLYYACIHLHVCARVCASTLVCECVMQLKKCKSMFDFTLKKTIFVTIIGWLLLITILIFLHLNPWWLFNVKSYTHTHTHTHIYIYIYIIMSHWWHGFPWFSLSLSVLIIHHSWQVLQTTSRFRTELFQVNSCWSTITGTFMCRGP